MGHPLFIRFALLVALIVAGLPGASVALVPPAPCGCCEHTPDGPGAGECCTMTPVAPEHHAILTTSPVRPVLAPVASLALRSNAIDPRQPPSAAAWRPPGDRGPIYLRPAVLRI